MEDCEVLDAIRVRVSKMQPQEVQKFIDTCKHDGELRGLDKALEWMVTHDIGDKIIYQYCYDFRQTCPKEVKQRLMLG